MIAPTPRIEKKPSSLRYYQDGPPLQVDGARWRLAVDSGLNGRTEFSLADILNMPQLAENRRVVCVCNWSIRRTWTGVLLQHLLESAGVAFSEDAILKQTSIGTAEKGRYDSCIRLADAVRRRAMIVHSVDGGPLPIEQGFPVRLIDFGLYGYKGVKGLEELTLTTNFALGHWEKLAGYDIEGRIKTKKYWCVDLGEHRFIRGDGEVVDF